MVAVGDATMDSFDLPFERALEEIDRVSTFDELTPFIRDLLEPYGLCNVVYHASHLPGLPGTHPLLVLTYPVSWIDRYFEKDYFRVDPVVAEASRSILPFDWDRLERWSPQVRNFFGESVDAGVGRHGLTLPVRGPSGELALFSLTSEANDRDWTLLRSRYMRDFQVIAHYVHARATQLAGAVPTREVRRLSPRERQCLEMLASGYPVKRMSHVLSLSESAVRLYLDSARHKLMAINKHHAVARAVAWGIISPMV